MTEKQREIRRVLESAIECFNNNEKYLIENDLSERCLCSKFAMYIERALVGTEFNDYMVDVEYNRGSFGKGFSPKILCERNIVVDLVVHKRGYDEECGFDNLFCVEMKKKYRNVDLTSDKDRLQKMTDNAYGFCYRSGFMILICADKLREEYKLEIEHEYLNVCDF